MKIDNLEKVGVIGAGMMGAEIALCFARAGYETVLCDVSLDLAERGKKKQEEALDRSIKKGKLEAAQKEEILARVAPAAGLEAVSRCGFIVEAVLEELEVKSHLFAELDGICRGDAVIASNTSSISITKLASAVSQKRAGRFIGAHFNSPASVMKLVEVIPGLLTDGNTVKGVMALLAAIGQEPVLVKDVTGFALNRIFHCMYLEACRLVEEGVCSPEDADKICKFGLGHPMGIFKLLDITGHDLNQRVDQILFDAYGDRFRPSPQIQRLVDAGRLGRKTGAGFYDYGEK